MAQTNSAAVAAAGARARAGAGVGVGARLGARAGCPAAMMGAGKLGCGFPGKRMGPNPLGLA